MRVAWAGSSGWKSDFWSVLLIDSSESPFSLLLLFGFLELVVYFDCCLEILACQIHTKSQRLLSLSVLSTVLPLPSPTFLSLSLRSIAVLLRLYCESWLSGDPVRMWIPSLWAWVAWESLVVGGVAAPWKDQTLRTRLWASARLDKPWETASLASDEPQCLALRSGRPLIKLLSAHSDPESSTLRNKTAICPTRPTPWSSNMTGVRPRAFCPCEPRCTDDIAAVIASEVLAYWVFPQSWGRAGIGNCFPSLFSLSGLVSYKERMTFPSF